MADTPQTTFSKNFFLCENYCIFIQMSLRPVAKDPNDNHPAMVQVTVLKRQQAINLTKDGHT